MIRSNAGVHELNPAQNIGLDNANRRTLGERAEKRLALGQGGQHFVTLFHHGVEGLRNLTISVPPRTSTGSVRIPRWRSLIWNPRFRMGAINRRNTTSAKGATIRITIRRVCAKLSVNRLSGA